MRIPVRLWAELGACLLLTLGETALAADAGTFEPLRGAWMVTGAEQSGKPFDAIKGGKLTITGEHFDLMTAAGNHLEGTLRLNNETSPRQIDFVLSTGPVWVGIYSVNATTFRLHYVEQEDGAKRPTVFATTTDTPGTVIVMKKADAAAAKPAA